MQPKTKCTSCDEYSLEEFSPASKFNENQLDCIKRIASKIRCPHINAIELLWGPPGSGKTQVAVTLVQLLHSSLKILVCVPREKDIHRFVQRIEELFPSFNLRKIIVISSSKDLENVCKFPETSLENRAQELYCCLYFWRGWLKEIDFVLQLEPYCKDNCEHEDKMCTKNNLLVFPFEYFRSKICELMAEFTECSKDLIKIFSGIYLSDAAVENINKLMNKLSVFKLQMFSDNITSSSVKRAFGFPSVDLVLEDAKHAESLNEKRMDILQLVQSLIGSVVLPNLLDRNALEDFCIESSQIVICTPHSPRLLGLKPCFFDTPLVDDAAQITESHLLVPLSLLPRNVILLGDHLHLQPTVKSEVYPVA